MLRREEAWREQGRDGSPVSSLVEMRREPVMRRGKHMAGKRFFRGGKCHIYGTEEKEGGRGRWKRWEERWTRAATGAPPPWSLEKLIQVGCSCGRQRDVGADVEETEKI